MRRSTLVRVMSEQDIELHLFHGRGGTISRGGGKTHTAVLGAPPGTVNGRLRVTEQGEIINEKFGLRGIALRTLEQVAGSVALATAMPEHRGNDKAEWHGHDAGRGRRQPRYLSRTGVSDSRVLRLFQTGDADRPDRAHAHRLAPGVATQRQGRREPAGHPLGVFVDAEPARCCRAGTGSAAAS